MSRACPRQNTDRLSPWSKLPFTCLSPHLHDLLFISKLESKIVRKTSKRVSSYFLSPFLGQKSGTFGQVWAWIFQFFVPAKMPVRGHLQRSSILFPLTTDTILNAQHSWQTLQKKVLWFYTVILVGPKSHKPWQFILGNGRFFETSNLYGNKSTFLWMYNDYPFMHDVTGQKEWSPG